ncbi:MAG: lysophospholipid acyltransferase family protein [Acidimicrobiales bacterium]
MQGTTKYWLYRAIAGILRVLPEQVASGAAYVASQAVMFFNSGYRRYYEDAVCHALGGDLSTAELNSWVRRVSRSYARYWVDGIRLADASGYEVDSRMMVESGMEHLEEAMKSGKGTILALAHMGSWEWGGAWLYRYGMRVTAVAEVLEPPKLYEWFASSRERMGIGVIPLGKGAAGKVSARLRKGETVALICDRDVTGQGVEVDLFGDRAILPPGPALLSLRTGASVLPTVVYVGPDGLHIAVIGQPVQYAAGGDLRKDVELYTRLIVSRLEPIIRRAPGQWYVFSHNWMSQRDSKWPEN